MENIFYFGSELLLVTEQFRKVLNKSLSFLISFLFQLLLFQKVLIGFEFFKFCDFWIFAIFKSFAQCHGRWYWKTKLSNYTWIRDIHLLCKLSIQSSLWIWFNESRSVSHFLFIIQHQIIFIIFYSLGYLHLILYLFFFYLFTFSIFILFFCFYLSIFIFYLFYLFSVFLFHFFVFIYSYLFYFDFIFRRFFPNHDFSTDRNWECLKLFVRT